MGNLFEYASNKSRLVVRSFPGAETSDLAGPCGSAIVMKHCLTELLGKTLKIEVLKKSETLFHVTIRNLSTAENRFMIDVKAEREAYRNGIIDDIIWIRRKYNRVADMKNAAVLP